MPQQPGSLQPLWRRRTRHGRVLSLDAALGDGLSLHDLIAADIAPPSPTPRAGSSKTSDSTPCYAA